MPTKSRLLPSVVVIVVDDVVGNGEPKRHHYMTDVVVVPDDASSSCSPGEAPRMVRLHHHRRRQYHFWHCPNDYYWQGRCRGSHHYRRWLRHCEEGKKILDWTLPAWWRYRRCAKYSGSSSPSSCCWMREQELQEAWRLFHRWSSRRLLPKWAEAAEGQPLWLNTAVFNAHPLSWSLGQETRRSNGDAEG